MTKTFCQYKFEVATAVLVTSNFGPVSLELVANQKLILLMHLTFELKHKYLFPLIFYHVNKRRIFQVNDSPTTGDMSDLDLGLETVTRTTNGHAGHTCNGHVTNQDLHRTLPHSLTHSQRYS